MCMGKLRSNCSPSQSIRGAFERVPKFSDVSRPMILQKGQHALSAKDRHVCKLHFDGQPGNYLLGDYGNILASLPSGGTTMFMTLSR